MAIVVSTAQSARRQEVLRSWQKKFAEGTDYDNWGHFVEAGEVYGSIQREISDEVQSPDLNFSQPDTVILCKIISAVDTRCKHIQSPDAKECPLDLSDITKICKAFGKWSEGKPLPEVSAITLAKVEPRASAARRPSEIEVEEVDGPDEHFMSEEDGGESTLVPKPTLGPGKTLLTIHLERIGLKDAPEHIDPFIKILVRDTAGIDKATPQRTAIASKRGDLYLEFNVDVYIDIPVQEFQEDVAIFFELWHYKQKKNKRSSKCFSFLEREEITKGPAVLEVYRKPTNFKRKKLSLLSVKPLYLHLTMELT